MSSGGAQGTTTATIGSHRVSVQSIHFPRIFIELKDKSISGVTTRLRSRATSAQTLVRPYQRRRGGCGVQEGCEVLVCVRVLVLVVVLMELKGKGWDAGLVLRRSARRTRRGAGHRRAAGRAAARSRCVVFGSGRAASAVTF